MAAWFKPDLFVPSVTGIDLGDLKARGLAGLCFDLDNTLVPWNTADVSPEIRDWFREVHAAGLPACIVTNAGGQRVSSVSELLKVPSVVWAGKPSVTAFLAGARLMGVNPARVAMVGDQIFTDIFGAKRAGMFTILVAPITPRDFATTKILRLAERFYLRRWQREGLIPPGYRS